MEVESDSNSNNQSIGSSVRPIEIDEAQSGLTREMVRVAIPRQAKITDLLQVRESRRNDNGNTWHPTSETAERTTTSD